MDIKTRHITFSWAGVVAVVTALNHDAGTIQAQVATYVPVIIGMVDWFSAQIRKYIAVYQAAKSNQPTPVL